MEERQRVKYVGGSHGMSFRLGKGVTYRIGAFKGRRVPETISEITDQGRLYLTNRRVCFIGSKKNVTYSIKQLVGFVPFEDGIQFQKTNESSPKYFMIDNNKFAVEVLGMLVSQLASQVQG